MCVSNCAIFIISKKLQLFPSITAPLGIYARGFISYFHTCSALVAQKGLFLTKIFISFKISIQFQFNFNLFNSKPDFYIFPKLNTVVLFYHDCDIYAIPLEISQRLKNLQILELELKKKKLRLLSIRF